MLKPIIVCADDFSQNEKISEGILLLAGQQRINAISCLVNLPNWQDCAQALKPLAKRCQIGLHLNFTFGHALSSQWRKAYGLEFPKLSAFIRQSYLGRFEKSCVEAEIQAQLEAFTQGLGRNPDFIDGHQHVHQLPLVREALLAVYREKKLTSFCRNTNSAWRHPKQAALFLLGGYRFKNLLKENKIPTNLSFAGTYPFAKAKNYQHYFKQFLRQTKPGGLIICHPGLSSADQTDPLHPYRHYEFDYLLSNNYLSDLSHAQCQLIQKVG